MLSSELGIRFSYEKLLLLGTLLKACLSYILMRVILFTKVAIYMVAMYEMNSLPTPELMVPAPTGSVYLESVSTELSDLEVGLQGRCEVG